MSIQLDVLREKVKPYLTPKRYAHTLATEKEAARLAAVYLPQETERLCAAALLHDITKKLDLPEHLKICDEFGIMYGKYPEREKKLFHAKTAVEVIKRDFKGFYDDGILAAVRWHTTGRAGMTMLETLVYLADYIEETRSFPDCVMLRGYFYGELAKKDAQPEKVLVQTLVLSFDLTIKNLIDEESLIDSDTVSARNYYVVGDCPSVN